MIDKKCKIIISCLGFILVFIVLLSIIACEPETKIAFDNQRDQDITLFIANVQENGTIDKLTEYGTIPADTVKTLYVTFLGEKWVNRIQIRDTLGNVIFTHDYKMADLEKIGWKIVIPK